MHQFGLIRLIGFLGMLLLGLAPAWPQNANDGFDPNANAEVRALAVQVDGKILVAGNFTTIAGGSRTHLARLLVDGTADSGFANNVLDGVVYSLAIQADERIVIAGSFTQVGAFARNDIARLNADGSVDSTFNPHANFDVRALAVQADGKILLGGQFTTLANGATARNSIARLNADGSVDSTFDPNANSTVLALAVQADGKILMGGQFTTLANGATARNHIARLNADGSVDTTFDPNANSTVHALAVQADGKILLGGQFTTLANGATARNRIARLNADGSVDSAFNPNANSPVLALAVQADGKILMGGNFTFLAGGATARNSIARLNADGSVDSTFDPNANGTVVALAVQLDGKILMGGVFTSLANGATTRIDIARLSTPDAALQALTLNGTTLTWRRSGAGPELALPPTLEFSVGGTSYAPVGTLSRVPGGWQGGGVAQPVGQTFYLRARGPVSSGSQGLIESVRQFFGNDRIFGDGFQ